MQHFDQTLEKVANALRNSIQKSPVSFALFCKRNGTALHITEEDKSFVCLSERLAVDVGKFRKYCSEVRLTLILCKLLNH